MKKWDAEKFTINARLKILTRLMLNRVNRRVNAINPAALEKSSILMNRATGFTTSYRCSVYVLRMLSQIHHYNISGPILSSPTLAGFISSLDYLPSGVQTKNAKVGQKVRGLGRVNCFYNFYTLHRGIAEYTNFRFSA